MTGWGGGTNPDRRHLRLDFVIRSPLTQERRVGDFRHEQSPLVPVRRQESSNSHNYEVQKTCLTTALNRLTLQDKGPSI